MSSTMLRIGTVFAIGCLGALGCGKDKGGGGGGGSCPALEVTIDGEAVALPHGISVKDKMGGYTVQVFNTDEVTCEEMLNKYGRPVKPDEIAVRAYVTEKGDMPGVGIDAFTQLGVDLKLAATPKAEGEPTRICVPDKITFTPNMGRYKDKKVTAVGLFEGAYCGQRP